MKKTLRSKHKLCRRLGKPVCGSPKCPVLKRPYSPGQHGKKGRKFIMSVYAQQLQEKQKLLYMYGITEKQLENVYAKALAQKGLTGENMLIMLESRLDNIIYRLGFVSTRLAARQLISHRHIQVDDQTVTIGSYSVAPGQKITIKRNSSMIPAIQERLKTVDSTLSYLSLDKETLTGRLTSLPLRSQIPEEIGEHLVVEFYAR